MGQVSSPKPTDAHHILTPRSSSQQRIESSRRKLSEQYNSLSLLDNPAFGRSILAMAARNTEEVIQRGISAMKVEEWNRASGLWLMSNVPPPSLPSPLPSPSSNPY